MRDAIYTLDRAVDEARRLRFPNGPDRDPADEAHHRSAIRVLTTAASTVIGADPGGAERLVGALRLAVGVLAGEAPRGEARRLAATCDALEAQLLEELRHRRAAARRAA